MRQAARATRFGQSARDEADPSSDERAGEAFVSGAKLTSAVSEYAYVFHALVPADRLDRRPVLEDFGARAGCAWRETDEADTNIETVLQDILSGQYDYPLRIVCFNPVEGWSRDATSDVADALAERAANTGAEISPALQNFIRANAMRRIDVQLALPLRGIA